MSLAIFAENKLPSSYGYAQLVEEEPCFTIYSKFPPSESKDRRIIAPNTYLVVWKDKLNTHFGRTCKLYYIHICVKSFDDLPIGSITTEGTITGYSDSPVIVVPQEVVVANPMDRVDFDIIPKDERGRIAKDALKPFMARFNLDDTEMGKLLAQKGYKKTISNGKRYYTKEG